LPPLSLTSHQHDTRLRNGHPQRPWPSFGDELGNSTFPTGSQTVSYGSSTWRTGNSETFPVGLCSPFQPSHSVCSSRLSPRLNLPFTTAYIAPLLITLKTAAIHPTSSILPPQQKASPPATRSHLLLPPWLSCSQATAACPRPPPWPRCFSPAGTTPAATAAATLTFLGLTTGKATGQVISYWCWNPQEWVLT
jgi:hypothetical protein